MNLSGALWVALLPSLMAQPTVPVFTPASVVPALAAEAHSPRPGMLVSIYGSHLGPDAGCTSPAAPNLEPLELCGTSVTLDGRKARLLYVQQRQINLRLPPDISVDRSFLTVVRHDGLASTPVPVLLSPMPAPTVSKTEGARISLEGTAYVRMPIWIRVVLPGMHQRMVRYPITIRPGDLGGHSFEVRRNGQDLPRIQLQASPPRADGGIVSFGSIGGGQLLGLPHEPRVTGRLPLHLSYRFDEPGRYEVRYTASILAATAGTAPLIRSEWLPIEVKPITERQRLLFLETLSRAASSDPTELLSELLPSALASNDARTLEFLETYLYHPTELVRQYSLYALYGFNDSDLVRWLPEVIRRRGPTPELAYLLSWRRGLFQPRSRELLDAVSGHLRSDAPNLVASGALQSLVFFKPPYEWRLPPQAVSGMDALVTKYAESLLSSHRQIPAPLPLYLGTVKTDTSRQLLWRLVDERSQREQALICLTWIADTRDLPRLASYLETNSLEYHLNRAYGEAAAPYISAFHRRANIPH